MMIRHLVVIQHLLADEINSNNLEIQETFKASNFVLEQHLILIRECINTLEGIRDKENLPSKKDRFSFLLKKLHQLI